MNKVFENILDFIFPQNITCNICGDDIFDDDEHSICKNCTKKLPFITGKVCKRCGIPIYSMADFCDRCQNKTQYYVKARAVFYYKNEVAGLIRRLKFKNGKFLAENLGTYLADLYKKENFDCDIITFVPMHENSLKKRGFNQAELLAKRLSQLIDVPCDELLIKYVDTKHQVDLNFKQRQENLKDAFKIINKQKVKGKKVLVVDDVFTTGSTINNCSKVLLNYGAKQVFALTIAHTIVQDENLS